MREWAPQKEKSKVRQRVGLVRVMLLLWILLVADDPAGLAMRMVRRWL